VGSLPEDVRSMQRLGVTALAREYWRFVRRGLLRRAIVNTGWKPHSDGG
jgi:hypothetical protein